jgi:hypothetical protein
MISEKQKQYFQEYYLKNKDKRNEQSAKWRKSNKEKCKEYVYRWRNNNRMKTHKIDKRAHLKNRHGITSEGYTKMLLNQNGCCEICGKPHTDYKRSFHVDHNHLTGNIRGLLCVRCNAGIGYFKDNTDLLEKAKLYLTKYAILEKVKDLN